MRKTSETPMKGKKPKGKGLKGKEPQRGMNCQMSDARSLVSPTGRRPEALDAQSVAWAVG